MLCPFRIPGILLGLTSFLISCSQKPSRSQVQGVVVQNEERRTDPTSVCWESMEPETADLRKRIEIVVASEFDRAGVKFFGFGACTNDPKEIRVALFKNINDSKLLGPNILGVVDQIGRKASRVDLLIADSNCESSPGIKVDWLTSNCLLNVALHEFGHVAGLYHEDLFSANNAATLLMGQTFVGHYDEQSVMSYKNLHASYRMNTRLTLSKGDIAALINLNQGAIAEFEQLPPSIAYPQQVVFGLKNTQLKKLEIKAGKDSNIDCAQEEGYQALLDFGEDYTLEFESLQRTLEHPIKGDGIYSVCFLGTSQSGKRQAVETYTGTRFEFIPLPVLPDFSELGSSKQIYNLSVKDELVQISLLIKNFHGFSSMRINLEDEAQDPSAWSEFVSPDSDGRINFVFPSNRFLSKGVHRIGSLVLRGPALKADLYLQNYIPQFPNELKKLEFIVNNGIQ